MSKHDLEDVLADNTPIPAGTTSGFFSAKSIADLMAQPIPEHLWLVEDLLPEGGFSYLIGRDKSGKSTLALELMLCVARGEPFLGRPVQQGVVLYLALEGNEDHYNVHFHRMGVEPDIDGEWFTFVHTTERPPATAVAELEHEIRATGASLVVIDTLFKFFPDVSASNYNKVNRALASLYDVASRTGCHITFLHHASKSAADKGMAALLAGGGLGSASIGGAVDTKMAIHKDEDGRVTFQTENRYGVDFPQSLLIFDPATKRLTVGAAPDRNAEVDEKVVEALRKAPMSVEMEVKRAVGGNQTLVSLALRRLTAAGTLVRHGAGGKGNPYRYTVQTPAEGAPAPKVEPVAKPALKLVAEAN